MWDSSSHNIYLLVNSNQVSACNYRSQVSTMPPTRCKTSTEQTINYCLCTEPIHTYLHYECFPAVCKVMQQLQIQSRPEVVAVGHEQILDTIIDQLVKHAGAKKGRIDISMARRTPTVKGVDACHCNTTQTKVTQRCNMMRCRPMQPPGLPAMRLDMAKTQDTRGRALVWGKNEHDLLIFRCWMTCICSQQIHLLTHHSMLSSSGYLTGSRLAASTFGDMFCINSMYGSCNNRQRIFNKYNRLDVRLLQQ